MDHAHARSRIDSLSICSPGALDPSLLWLWLAYGYGWAMANEPDCARARHRLAGCVGSRKRLLIADTFTEDDQMSPTPPTSMATRMRAFLHKGRQEQVSAISATFQHLLYQAGFRQAHFRKLLLRNIDGTKTAHPGGHRERTLR